MFGFTELVVFFGRVRSVVGRFGYTFGCRVFVDWKFDLNMVVMGFDVGF